MIDTFLKSVPYCSRLMNFQDKPYKRSQISVNYGNQVKEFLLMERTEITYRTKTQKVYTYDFERFGDYRE